MGSAKQVHLLKTAAKRAKPQLATSMAWLYYCVKSMTYAQFENFGLGYR